MEIMDLLNKKRDYKWPFPVHNHVFGKTDRVATNEGKACLTFEPYENTFPKTKIVN